MIGNKEHVKKVLLISMPWQNFSYPSMQLGVLKASLQKNADIKCDTLYAYLLWVEYICDKWRDHEKDEVLELLDSLAIDYAYHCLGDWVFSKALYGYDYRKKEYLDYLENRSGLTFTKELIQDIEHLYEDAPSFIKYLLKKIDIETYDVIGFSNTFSQTVASLALATEIKKALPSVTIIMGGANCDDIQGATLLKQYACFDYIFSGEGEDALPKFVKLYSNESFNPKDISGLIYRKENQEMAMTPEVLVEEENTLYPEYEDYFELLEELEISEFIQPQILIEIAKGCWWGDKSQCVFCGINEKRSKFRCKPEDKIIENLLAYSKRYSCGDIFFVDNIMDYRYYKSLLPKMKKLDYDYDLFWEIKANLTREKAVLLRDANVRNLQPGIESFCTEVLEEMRKGITGIQNVYTLKLAREYALNLSWNILFGLPEEKDEYYMVDKWRGLFHLEAPISQGRIVLERHSPLFCETKRGMINKGPIEPYYYIYQFKEQDMYNYAYMFNNEKCGISEEKELEIKQLVEEWNDDKRAVLFYKKRKNVLEIIDTRASRKCDRYLMEKPIEQDALLYLKDIRNYKELYRYLIEEKGYSEMSEFELDKWLEDMIQLRFIYDENKKYLSLVLPYDRNLYGNL